MQKFLLLLVAVRLYGQVNIGAGVSIGGSPVQGVFNVRLSYGGNPDGSTDNATAIANAFAASNAVSTGIPVVYFDCNGAAATCQYNYSGSGTSPINPTQATSIVCAPGVYLNYTGSAHAIDLGASGRTFQEELPYLIQGCVFTGAASSTHGIYVNSFITNTNFIGNTFLQFGNRTGFNIYYAGNNWESLVQGNNWFYHDGVTRNTLDGHNLNVNAVRFLANNVECTPAINTGPCNTTNQIGVGVWLGALSVIDHNVIQFHSPLVRLANTSSATGDRVKISGNHFEGNSGILFPAISYGDPGGTATAVGCLEYSGNTLFWPAGTGTPIVGPETPASGSYSLSGCPFLNNGWSTPSSGTYFVNTNGGANNIWGRNQTAGTVHTAGSTSPSVFSNNLSNSFLPLAKKGNAGALSGLVAFQTNGQDIMAGTYHTVSAAMVCVNSVASGTAQVCNTSPSTADIVAGSNLAPVAGDMIIFKTNTTNTGDLTINVNGTGAVHVMKNQGTATLASGDLQSNAYIPLVFDGTNWEIGTVHQ